MVRRGGDVRVTGALPNSLDVSFDIREDLIFWGMRGRPSDCRMELQGVKSEFWRTRRALGSGADAS